MDFYRKVVERVRVGEPYEAAAVSEQRAEHYALRPFVAVRPPLLATFLARLPPGAAQKLLAALAVAVILAWTVRLRPFSPGPIGLAASAFAVLTGAGWAFFPKVELSLIHEAWAGLLIALALALRTERRFAASLAVGLLAAFVRELAAPFLLVMALAALAEKKKLEALCFFVAINVELAALYWHAHALAPLISASDRASQGWVRFSGWPFVLSAARWNILVLLAGQWMAAILVPLAIMGAAGRSGGLALRLAALLAGYVASFLIVGRPENYYWGLLIAPLIGAGAVLSPGVVVALWRSATGARQAAPA
jgi:hypothetical protein